MPQSLAKASEDQSCLVSRNQQRNRSSKCLATCNPIHLNQQRPSNLRATHIFLTRDKRERPTRSNGVDYELRLERRQRSGTALWNNAGVQRPERSIGIDAEAA